MRIIESEGEFRNLLKVAQAIEFEWRSRRDSNPRPQD